MTLSPSILKNTVHRYGSALPKPSPSSLQRTSSSDIRASSGDQATPGSRRFPAQVVRCPWGAGDGVGSVSSAAASCCDRGGRTMNGMMALTSMMTEIT